MQEMDKVYNPQAIEGELYREWEESGAFEAHRVAGKKPFTIVMPPPNITGQLHMGHAMDSVMQDSLTRYHRMKGDPTLWLPGTDHASIATEVKIVEAMRKEGLTKEDHLWGRGCWFGLWTISANPAPAWIRRAITPSPCASALCMPSPWTISISCGAAAGSAARRQCWARCSPSSPSWM